MTTAASTAQEPASEPALEELMLRADRATLAASLSRGMAHDLRGPLQTLTLIADPHMDLLAGSEGARLRGVLSDAVHQLTDTVTRFGQIYAPADGEPSPLIVDDLVSQIAILQRYQRGLPSVELEMRQLGGLPPVRGVEPQIRHILLSLVTNAKLALAGRPDGRLVLATEVGEGVVRIAVEDDGPGLTAEARTRAFEPFFSTHPGRMGIGLPVARIMAERLGGAVALRDREGSQTGCCAVLTLPVWRRHSLEGTARS